MTGSPPGASALPVNAVTGRGPGTAGRVSARARWRGWAIALPGIATFAATMYGIGAASFWRDEAATLSAVRRPLPDLVAMLGHVDAVHGAYYLLMWPLAHVAGTSEMVTRLPSAAAMAGAACGVAACARRLRSWQAGLWAGLVFAALPMTSRYGQEARSYALVTAAAVLASYLLVRMITEPGGSWVGWYGLSLAVLGWLNLFGLLIVPAHAVTLALARRHGAAARGWAIAVVAAGAAAAPVAAMVWLERGQFAWLPGLPPGWHDLYLLAVGLAGGAASLILIAAASVLGAMRAGGREIGGPTGPRLIWLSAPWLVLPPAILSAVSRIEPSYQPRYLVFCLPAVAMLAGPGLAALEGQWLLATGLVVLLAGLGLPVQHAIREPAGHGEDIRAVARLLGTQTAPGDAVIWDDPGTRTDSFAYESQFIRLRDISLRQTPAEAENLGGTQASPSIVQNRLRQVIRAWIIQVGSHRFDPAAVLRGRFRLVRGWRISDIAVRLFARPAAPGKAHVTRVATGRLRPERRLPGIPPQARG